MRSLVAASSPMAKSFHLENIVSAWDKGNDWVCRGAPHIVIAYALKDDPIAPQACTIALTYLELSAASLGLGACWAGYVSMALNMSEEARRYAGLSSKTSCQGAMMVGYPKVKYSRIPLRNKPRILWR
jgi:nitroreductase